MTEGPGELPEKLSWLLFWLRKAAIRSITKPVKGETARQGKAKVGVIMLELVNEQVRPSVYRSR